MTKKFTGSLLAACLMLTGSVSTALGLPEDPNNHPTCSAEKQEFDVLDQACDEAIDEEMALWYDWQLCQDDLLFDVLAGFDCEMQKAFYEGAQNMRRSICDSKLVSYTQFLECLAENSSHL